MTAWLKRNWLNILGGIIVLVFIYSTMDSIITKITYKKQIREKDMNISQLYQGIKDSQKREKRLINQANESYALAMEKEAKLRKKDQEMRVKIAEKRALKKKIREMPATQVIVRTIEIINCPEVVQQEQGIVFTLVCAKKNLTVLEASFSLKKEVVDWTEKFNTSQAEVLDLKNVIISKDGEIKEVKSQLVGEEKIIEEWTGKFNLSEKRGKRSWWKGFKKGATYGGIAGFFIGLFSGK